jgi:hypothetical protein
MQKKLRNSLLRCKDSSHFVLLLEHPWVFFNKILFPERFVFYIYEYFVINLSLRKRCSLKLKMRSHLLNFFNQIAIIRNTDYAIRKSWWTSKEKKNSTDLKRLGSEMLFLLNV